MAIDSRFLAELKMRNEVAATISSYVQLKRNGTRHVGLCPFHGEKTPSFTVFENTQSFYCFGCGAGGDVISFIMKYQNLDYVEAVRYLAERSGMSLPEDDQRHAEFNRKKHQRLYDMHKAAARFFYKTLMSPQGKAGLDYLTGRGLTRESIVKFGLGYAPDSFDALKKHLTEQGFSPSELLDGSLLTRKEGGSHTYDKFRGRVMFPIFDVRGNVVAFSGRLLGDGKPKYLNSNETEIYTKGQHIFGMQIAKNEPEGLMILCEGNLDVVALHQAGFGGAVAPLGTAFTKEQARILVKYAKRVVVAFDNDSAGLKATDKALAFLEENGIPVRVLQMSGAKDPDEFIKTYGRERFATLIKASKTPMEYRLEQLKAGMDLSDTGMMVEYQRKAVEIIAAVDSAVERDIYTLKLAQELKLSSDAVRSEVARVRKRKVASVQRKTLQAERQELSGTYDQVNPERAGNLRAARAEEMMIAILTNHPNLAQIAQRELPPAEMATEFNRRVYEFILREYRDAEVKAPIFVEEFNEKEMARISFFINTSILHGDPEAQMMECIEIIKKEGAKRVDTDALSPEELMRRLSKGD